MLVYINKDTHSISTIESNDVNIIPIYISNKDWEEILNAEIEEVKGKILELIK